MKKITYVTGNWAKVESAKKFFEPLGVIIDNKKIDPIEIQANTVEEIASFSAKHASEILGCDVLKNDTGLFIEALNGFPGPYTHYVDETLGEDAILKLMDGIDNRKAKFIEAYAYCEVGKEPLVFTSITEGTIAKYKQGIYGWSWDYIFIKDGDDKTLACYEDEERFKKWNQNGLIDLAKYLNNNDSK